jgi:hypothetical protein
MNVRRFGLRLMVGLLCFVLGWASAVLLGASRVVRRDAPAPAQFEFYVPHFAAPPPPRFEFGHPRRHGCEAWRVRPAYEWHTLEPHEPPRGEDFEHYFDEEYDHAHPPAPPAPPAPPRPRRAPRPGN